MERDLLVLSLFYQGAILNYLQENEKLEDLFSLLKPIQTEHYPKYCKKSSMKI